MQRGGRHAKRGVGGGRGKGGEEGGCNSMGREKKKERGRMGRGGKEEGGAQGGDGLVGLERIWGGFEDRAVRWGRRKTK